MVFFFQAEDGIRDHCVTGVQTCALPICLDVTTNSGRVTELNADNFRLDRINPAFLQENWTDRKSVV